MTEGRRPADRFPLCAVPILVGLEADERSLRQVLDFDLGDEEVALLAALRRQNLDLPLALESCHELGRCRGRRRLLRLGRSLGEGGGACGRQEQSAENADENLSATYHGDLPALGKLRA